MQTDSLTQANIPHALREKCPNTGLILVRIFRIRTRNNSVFGNFSRSNDHNALRDSAVITQRRIQDFVTHLWQSFFVKNSFFF